MFKNDNIIDADNPSPQVADAAELLVDFSSTLITLPDGSPLCMSRMTDSNHLQIQWSDNISKDVATHIESKIQDLADEKNISKPVIQSNVNDLLETADVSLADCTKIVDSNTRVLANASNTKTSVQRPFTSSIFDRVKYAREDLTDSEMDDAVSLALDTMDVIRYESPGMNRDDIFNHSLANALTMVFEDKHMALSADDFKDLNNSMEL